VKQQPPKNLNSSDDSFWERGIYRSPSPQATYENRYDTLGTFTLFDPALETARDLGHLAPRQEWVHLFINQVYWGVYRNLDNNEA